MDMAASESILTERALWATAISVGLLLPLGGCPSGMEYGYKPTDEGAPDTAGPPGEPSAGTSAATMASATRATMRR